MILPKTVDINKAKAEERKREIDDGLILARKVDELRQLRVDMESNFETWRVNQTKVIQDEIDALIVERDELKLQNSEALERLQAIEEKIEQENY